MLLALHTISGALRMLSPLPPEEETAAEPEPEATGRSGGIIDWADDDESETVRSPMGTEVSSAISYTYTSILDNSVNRSQSRL